MRETIAEEVKEQARRLARAEVQGVEVKLEQLQKILEEKLEKEVRQQARAEMREVQAKMGKEMEAMSAYVIEKLQHMETQVGVLSDDVGRQGSVSFQFRSSWTPLTAPPSPRAGCQGPRGRGLRSRQGEQDAGGSV